MPQLDFSTYWMQIFWLCVIFSALYCFVAYIFMPRLSVRIIARKTAIKDALAQSETLLLECKRLKADMDSIMSEVREHSLSIQKDAESEVKEMLELASNASKNHANDFLAHEEEKFRIAENEIRALMPAMVEDIKQDILKFFEQKVTYTNSYK